MSNQGPIALFLPSSLSPGDDRKLSSLSVPVPSNENDRLAVLRSTKILDSNNHDVAYDRLTTMASRVFKVK